MTREDSISRKSGHNGNQGSNVVYKKRLMRKVNEAHPLDIAPR